MARRDDRACREHVREEQRRQPGCPARELCREPLGRDTRSGDAWPRPWLFSVSSKSLAFVVWLHLALWSIAVIFAARCLRAALPEMPAGAVLLWLWLFWVVCFQVTTFLRPTLRREPNAPVVERGKLFFLDHFNDALK